MALIPAFFVAGSAQQINGSAPTSGTGTLSITNSVNAGDVVVIFYYGSDGSGTNTMVFNGPTDTQGNTYNLAEGSYTSTITFSDGRHLFAAVWAFMASTGSNVTTMTCTTTDRKSVV